MKIKLPIILIIFLCLNLFSIRSLFATKIISFGGYYAPQNTIASITLATNNQQTDYIYLSVSLTKDDVPIIVSSQHLQDFTNVEQVFPDKKREDGNYYSIDFTMQDILQLTIIHNKSSTEETNQLSLYNNIFKVLTLQDSITLIKSLNVSLSKNIGTYIFINSPYFNQKNGKDISKIVLNILSKNSLSTDLDNFYLSLEDYQEIIRIKDILLFKGDIILSIPEYKNKNYLKDINPNNDYESLLISFNKENPSKYIKGIELNSDYLFIENSFKLSPTYKGFLKYNLPIFIHIKNNIALTQDFSTLLKKYKNFNIITSNPSNIISSQINKN
jgi:glycerophosphoryl diester phosphodiesterase